MKFDDPSAPAAGRIASDYRSSAAGGEPSGAAPPARLPRLLAMLAVLLLVGAPALARLGGTELPGWLAANLVYPPSLLLNGALCWLFAHTLLPGRQPLISRLAVSVHGPLTPALSRYTRRVTQFWALFFAAVLVETALFWLGGVTPQWLLLAGALNALLALLALLVEFGLRRVCLPGVDHLGWRDYLTFLRRFDRAALHASRRPSPTSSDR